MCVLMEAYMPFYTLFVVFLNLLSAHIEVSFFKRLRSVLYKDVPIHV